MAEGEANVYNNERPVYRMRIGPNAVAGNVNLDREYREREEEIVDR